MTHLLVVFGATGQQGSSVINHVLSDSVLSSKYSLRGVTRDVTKPAAQDLQKKGVEIVPGDLDDPASIHAALRDAHTVFAMTRILYDEQAQARDERQGKAIADAAVASGAKYLIWGSSVHASNASGGKYPVPVYDAHYNVEQYIRGLPIQSAFVAPESSMQNMRSNMVPRPSEDGSYVIANIHSPQARFPWLDVEVDMGKFVGVVLDEPEKYRGKVLAAASCIHSFEDVVRILSEVSGKTVRYVEMPEEKFREFCPPGGADSIINMFWFIQELGYYGAETEKLVEWSVQQVKGKLVSLEEFAKTIQFA